MVSSISLPFSSTFGASIFGTNIRIQIKLIEFLSILFKILFPIHIVLTTISSFVVFYIFVWSIFLSISFYFSLFNRFKWVLLYVFLVIITTIFVPFFIFFCRFFLSLSVDGLFFRRRCRLLSWWATFEANVNCNFCVFLCVYWAPTRIYLTVRGKLWNESIWLGSLIVEITSSSTSTPYFFNMFLVELGNNILHMLKKNTKW